MGRRAAAALLAVLVALPALGANPCTNGSFEELDAKGFPVDWSAVGQTVEVTSDAHTGRRALRLLRTPETESRETGLNRAWEPDSGRQGAMINRLKGGIDFWYKAVSAEATQLVVYAIPMTADPIERTGSPRAAFVVPAQHTGDGRWHHAKLKYDFTDNEKARWVHFSARIVGKAGEVLLDDFAYVERVGPIVRFGKARLDESPDRPGYRCTFSVEVHSAGDEAARHVRASLEVPEGLTASPGEVALGDLPPDGKVWVSWPVEGWRTRACRFGLRAVSGESEALASFPLAPRLEVESVGPVSPVALEGEPIAFECVLRNPSHVVVHEPLAVFEFPTGLATCEGSPIAPGEAGVLRATFTPPHETPEVRVPVRVTAGDGSKEASLTTTLVVGSSALLPGPAGYLRAVATRDYGLLENEHVRLAFRRNVFGYGCGELQAMTPRGWRTVAWLPRLSRIVQRYPDGIRHESAVFTAEPPRPLKDRTASLLFYWTARDVEGGFWQLTMDFALAPGRKHIVADYQLSCDKDRLLLAFDGPMLYALGRDEAVFPGLEWLVEGEVSSSTLDIAEGHPHQVRYVVHPNMVTIPAIGMLSEHGVVGLVWDVHQKWDRERDRPSVAFASPERSRHCRAHLAGLFLPTVPDFVEPNAREATKPYPMEADQPLRLQCRLFADGRATDALAAMDEWLRLQGLPEPPPLPHKTYEGEVQFSMRGYLESLWEAETKEWWSSKGGNPLMCKLGRPRAYVADLLVGELLSPDAAVRAQCRARAEEVLKLIGGEPRLDAQRLGGRADLAFANPGHAAGLLASMRDDGSWRFDADRRDQGVFKGMDYHELGPDEAVEVGTCAQRAFQVLRYARVAGDWDAYERMRKTLELMETFRVPRAAQVWEVPVHTPDILAAADAVDAYVEAWRFSGEERWLRDAVTWARRGLPFVYLWHDPQKPFLVGGSIPVFGATWFRGSWFGRPVQWNGLRYANALLKLDEYDQSLPWRHVAELVIRSAIHQQDLEGDNVALWPDNISAIDSARCPWVFAPRQILRNILKLTGRDEDPATVIVGQGRQRLHVSTIGKVGNAAWDGSLLAFSLTYPKGEQGVVLVANVQRPSGVQLNGKPVAEGDDIESGSEAGWRYDAAYGYLAIRVPRDGESVVRVEGARFRQVHRLPRLATAIAFEFDDSPDGWLPAHHVSQLQAKDGALVGQITGGDPYLVRGLMRVRGDDAPVITFRLRVTAGQGGQFYWTTAASPGFAEDKVAHFAVQPDGQWHDYRIEPGNDPMWSGQTITAIRIDPGNGAPTGDFAIDYVRGEKKTD